jgi:hypothetical protein
MITVTTVAKAHSACEDDLNPRCRRISVATSKQNVKGPKKMIFHVENGPCRDIVMALWVINAMVAVVDRYTLIKWCKVPNWRINIESRERFLRFGELKRGL